MARKIYTYIADVLCVILGSLLGAIIYHPEESLSGNILGLRPILLIVVITMAMFSVVFKIYNDPIRENVSLSVIASVGTFLISLALSVIILAFIDSTKIDPVHIVNIAIYSVFFLGAYRLMLHFVRRLDAYMLTKRADTAMNRVIIMGAGDAGKFLVDLLRDDKSKKLCPVAFIDDNPDLVGKTIKGLKVVGNRTMIPYAAEKYKASVIIIAIPFVDNSSIRDIFRLCLEAKCNVKRFGNMTTFTANGLSKATINEVLVEDLLGRPVVKLDLQNVREYISGKTVLISGGAGSIGFELCKQILNYDAKLVLVLDNNENKLSEAEAELGLHYPKSQFVSCLGSIQDRARLREIFEQYHPEVVFHAAAHKNVPLMELNPQEALKNNIMGTLYMVEMAIKYKTERFVLISTDKAVNPTSIMGASKRVAEMLIQRANAWGKTRFSAVRFGNVLFSSGSVVPIFKKQIQSGGPVTVTDKNTRRYFMTIPEAVQMVLETGALSKGGEIFVLDMGEPVNIYELAKSMISLSGLQLDKDIKIEITGLRPGEKLFEEINLSEENVAKTGNERIFILKSGGKPPLMFEAEFDRLCQSIDNSDFNAAFTTVGILVPSFRK